MFRPALGIVADLNRFAEAVAAMEPVQATWTQWTQELRSLREAQRAVPNYDGVLNLGTVMHEFAALLAPDAIVTTDAGNFAGWATRFINFRDGQRYIGPTNGAMGYSVPAAVGAKITFPERMVVSLVGDGGFLMTGAGDRHRVPPWRRADRHGVQQPDVRHDPHAPGTHLSMARVRHRADQPGFCEIHRGVRRPRRSGERDRRIRPGVSSRGGERPAGADRIAGEPGTDHHAADHRAVARRQGAAEARGETEAGGGGEASEAGASAAPARASRGAERCGWHASTGCPRSFAPTPPGSACPTRSSRASRRRRGITGRATTRRRHVSATPSCAAPADFDALHLRGVLHLDQEQPEEALAYLRRAEQGRPDAPQLLFHIGNALLALKLYDDAADAFRHSLALRPGDVDALNNLGNALSGGLRHAEAAACFRQALAIRPDAPQALYNLGRALLGSISWKQQSKVFVPRWRLPVPASRRAGWSISTPACARCWSSSAAMTMRLRSAAACRIRSRTRRPCSGTKASRC